MRKLAIGRAAFASPLRESRIAFATARTASGCPTTLSPRMRSILSNFSRSPASRRVVGMPVQRATISAICSGVTVSLPPPVRASSAALAASSRSIRACRSGIA